jgi:hypothetical protein
MFFRRATATHLRAEEDLLEALGYDWSPAAYFLLIVPFRRR